MMLIKNAGRCVRREELQEILKVDDWTMQRSLAWLERDHYIEHTKNGWYRVKKFPFDGARRPTK
jgi:Mn-dependent DtxR family transcriptional regulator